MAQVEPNASGLLDVARKTLLEDLLPALPKDRALTALMVANAVAIARRELDAPPEDDRELAEVLNLPAGMDGADIDRALAERLRAGAFTDREEATVRELLLARTKARLAISNPKYLAASLAER